MSIRFRQAALAQGIFLFLMGIWPLVSMHSFLRVTGPKIDIWLVTTVGLLLAVTGAVLCSAGVRNIARFEFVLLGFGTAASLAAIDIYFSIKGTISPVYLLDALVELGFLALWGSVLIGKNKEGSSSLS